MELVKMLGRTHMAIALTATALTIKDPAQLPVSLAVAAASSLQRTNLEFPSSIGFLITIKAA